jgi:uncharacterized small protein (DUF1192 family)
MQNQNNLFMNVYDGMALPRCVLQLKFLSFDELQTRMTSLDGEMEREIDELRRRYQTKRQPILDAMDQKKKRQQNF